MAREFRGKGQHGVKVTRNTAESLVLRDIPLGSGLLLFGFSAFPMIWGAALAHAGQAVGGLVLVGIGLILFLGCFGAFVQVLTIRLDRREGLAEVTETGMFGRKRHSHALNDLTGATLQSMVIRRKPGDIAESRRDRRLQPEPRVWRVALVHRDGRLTPVTLTYGAETSASLAAAAINGWFARP